MDIKIKGYFTANLVDIIKDADERNLKKELSSYNLYDTLVESFLHLDTDTMLDYEDMLEEIQEISDNNGLNLEEDELDNYFNKIASYIREGIADGSIPLSNIEFEYDEDVNYDVDAEVDIDLEKIIMNEYDKDNIEQEY